MWTQDDVEKAKNELAVKKLSSLQEETAYVWGARAMAAFQHFQTSNWERWLSEALEYRHEALEHAALAGPQVYYQVQVGLQELEAYL
jgi:hypothetical protein